MARPVKKGIDYFAVDVDFNNSFEILIAKYGNEGIGIWLRIIQNIYKKKGYYIDYNEDYILVMSNKLRITNEFFEEFINFCLKKDIFNLEQFNNNKILTSVRIQENYCEAVTRRKVVNVNTMYALTPELKSLCKQNVNKSTQIRLNETKLNKIKLNDDNKKEIKKSSATKKQIEFCKLNNIEYKNLTKNEVAKIIEEFINKKKSIYKKPIYEKVDIDEKTLPTDLEMDNIIDNVYKK